jgi:hypothetical protein
MSNLTVSSAVFAVLQAANQAAMQAALALDPTSSPTFAGCTLSALTLNFAGGAAGDIYYDTGGGVLVNLAIGSPGQVLTAGSGGPTWQASTAGQWGQITGTLSAQSDLQAALMACLQATNNLSDLLSISAAQSNLQVDPAGAAATFAAQAQANAEAASDPVGSAAAVTPTAVSEAVAAATAACDPAGAAAAAQSAAQTFCTDAIAALTFQTLCDNSGISGQASGTFTISNSLGGSVAITNGIITNWNAAN